MCVGVKKKREGKLKAQENWGVGGGVRRHQLGLTFEPCLCECPPHGFVSGIASEWFTGFVWTRKKESACDEL